MSYDNPGMKRFALCGIALAFAGSLFAQENKTLANELVKHWETSKQLSLEVAQAMPADDYNFKATPAEMSFGGQMNHIAAADGNYCSAAIGTKSPLGKLTDDSKQAAIKNLTTAYDYCIDGIKEMNEAELLKPTSFHGQSTTKFALFWGGFTHSAHHRGQAEVYLRLKGITPPAYKF
jgi:uncharacterized damage-inducible protein DinB